MTNAASYAVQTLALGTIVTVFGTSLGNAADTCVLLSERLAPIIGVAPAQVSFSISSDAA